jgi:Farnesoic acid 0-methyl transferase
MNCDEFLPFWVRWGNNSVEVGSGRLDEHTIMRLVDPEQPEIKALSITSWVTASAEYHFPQKLGKFQSLLQFNDAVFLTT